MEFGQLVKQLNESISDEVSRWGVDSTLEMEMDKYKDGFFYKTKNYFVRKEDGKIKFKGGAFLDSKRPLLCDKFRDEMAEMILDRISPDEIKSFIKQSMDISQYSLKDLTKRITMTKHRFEYAGNHLAAQLANIHKNHFNEEPPPFTRFEYIQSIDGPMLLQIAQEDKIDYHYYRKTLAKTAELFGYGEIAHMYAKNPGLNELQGGWF